MGQAGSQNHGSLFRIPTLQCLGGVHQLDFETRPSRFWNKVMLGQLDMPIAQFTFSIK
jgi:hypothetical protein